MSKTTKRLRKAAKSVVTRAGAAVRRAEQKVEQRVRQRRLKRSLGHVTEVAAAAGAAVLTKMAIDRAALGLNRRAAKQPEERPLGFEIRLPLSMESAIMRITDALKAEGFGILTRIDADEIFLEKLGVAFHDFTILGACNPSLAHKALTARSEAGLLLPCNVTVESLPTGGCLVRIADPVALLEATGLREDKEVMAVAKEAAKHLKQAAQWIRDHDHAAVL